MDILNKGKVDVLNRMETGVEQDGDRWRLDNNTHIYTHVDRNKEVQNWTVYLQTTKFLKALKTA